MLHAKKGVNGLIEEVCWGGGAFPSKEIETKEFVHRGRAQADLTASKVANQCCCTLTDNTHDFERMVKGKGRELVLPDVRTRAMFLAKAGASHAQRLAIDGQQPARKTL